MVNAENKNREQFSLITQKVKRHEMNKLMESTSQHHTESSCEAPCHRALGMLEVPIS